MGLMRHVVAKAAGLSAVVILAGFAVGPFAGCKDKENAGGGGGAQGAGDEIRLGEYASLTGGTADFGISSDNGLMLALEQANAAGGVLGRKIKIVKVDDESKSAENAVQRLISVDKVIGVIGEVASTRSLSGAGICQQKKIPMLSPASTNPNVTKQGDYIFRICFTDDFQGSVCAKFASSKGWKKVAVLTAAAEDYSKGLSKAFKETFTAAGGQIAPEVLSYTKDERDFKTQLVKIKAAGPDAVFVPGYYGEAGLIMSQARELQMTVPFFGGDGWDSPETMKLGAIADGCYFTNHYSVEDPSPESQAFVKAYQAKYNKMPDGMAVLGYDAGRVMFDALKRAGKADPAALRDALAQTKDFPGASGKITIDADRNARKPIVVLEIKDGKTRLERTIQPD